MRNSIQKIGSIGAILGIMLSLVTIAGIYYEKLYDKPILTYEELNTYPLPNQTQIVPVIIKNEGHAKASNVRIIIETKGERVNVMYKSLEQFYISNETTNTSYIVIAPRIIDGTEIIFYLIVKVTSDDPISYIGMTSDETTGKPHTQKDNPFLNIFIFIMGICCTLAALYIYRVYKIKKHV